MKNNHYKILITGVAGFIGSNILEHLLNINQRVVGFDNFSKSGSIEVNSLISLTAVKTDDWYQSVLSVKNFSILSKLIPGTSSCL